MQKKNFRFMFFGYPEFQLAVYRDSSIECLFVWKINVRIVAGEYQASNN